MSGSFYLYGSVVNFGQPVPGGIPLDMTVEDPFARWTILPSALAEIHRQHVAWLQGHPDGVRANLRGAFLDGADLSGMNLRKVKLNGASLRSADLKGTDLRGALLDPVCRRVTDLSNANLSGARFDRPIPLVPDLHQQVYAAASAPGALDMSFWHVCDTTHCRAGWAVTLAGGAGKELEGAISTPAAAALIYHAAYPDERTPNFYASNRNALEDMRLCAERAEREKRP